MYLCVLGAVTEIFAGVAVSATDPLRRLSVDWASIFMSAASLATSCSQEDEQEHRSGGTAMYTSLNRWNFHTSESLAAHKRSTAERGMPSRSAHIG